VQYTRNMVTGASTADLAIVLIDARKGVVEQTRRHAFIASLLGIGHVVVAVNKMDLVGHDEETFDRIVREYCVLSAGLGVGETTYIPMSALHGDNVVERSQAMGWYGGVPLLEHLETVAIAGGRDRDEARFPVQWVVRDQASGYRGYAGRVAGGVLRPGDDVVVLPAGTATTVAAVETFDGPLEAAVPALSVTVRLADDLDVSRGDLLCAAAAPPRVAREIEADVCWMADAPLRPGGRYALKHATATARAIVDAVVSRVDVATYATDPSAAELGLNDIGRVRLRTSRPLAHDAYAENRTTGSFILIDEVTNDTVGAGMIV
jgi:sulfate adenylyltransferase large subunit